MELKRYKDSNAHDAMNRIKKELGPDAIILSTEKTDEGTEIIAASHIDIDFLEQQMNANYSGNTAQEAVPSDIANVVMQSIELQAGNQQQMNQLQECIDQLSIEMVQLRASNSELQSRLHTEIVDRMHEMRNTQESGLRDQEKSRVESFHVLQQQINELRNDIVNRMSGLGEVDGEYFNSIQKDMEDLKEIINYQTSCIDWNSWSRQNSCAIPIVSRLAKAGFGIDLCKKVVASLPQSNNVDTTWSRAIETLASNIVKTDYDVVEEGGIFILMGPAGVGKTTTLAKIAARYTIAHGPENVLFVNTDDYRIGAQDQLSTYASILNIEQEHYAKKQDMRSLTRKIKEHRLVLIDTAGQNEPNQFLQQFIEDLNRNGLRPKCLLLMSASTQLDCLKQTIDHYRNCPLDGYIITKTDEALQLGNVLTLAIEDQIPLWYETNGQRVPEDISLIAIPNMLSRAFALNEATSAHSDQLERELLLSYQANQGN